jgi:hypothetical protein
MFIPVKRLSCLVSIALFGILGCSQTATVNAPAPPAAPTFKPGVPETPDAAMKAVLDGLKASKPVVIWDAMTSGQQASFNHYVRYFASNMDPEIWDRTVANLKKFALLAETKKDLILKSPLLKNVKQIKPEELKAAWDPGLKLLKTILQSELVDLEKLKNFDGHAFLEGTGATLFAQARELSHHMKGDPLKRIDELTATVTQSSDRSATAKLNLGGANKRTMEIPLSVDDGKWTSGQLGFLQLLLSERLDPIASRVLPYRLVDWKDGYLADMKRVDKILDHLQSAKTQDDFQSVVSSQLLPFVLQKTVQVNQKPKPMSNLEARSQGRTKGTAMLVIDGDHFADEPGMLELIKLCRDTAAEGNGMSSGPFGVDGVMILFVSPVSDTEGFAKKIHIAKIKKVDVRKNTISLDVPPDKTTAEAEGSASKSTGH